MTWHEKHRQGLLFHFAKGGHTNALLQVQMLPCGFFGHLCDARLKIDA